LRVEHLLAEREQRSDRDAEDLSEAHRLPHKLGQRASPEAVEERERSASPESEPWTTESNGTPDPVQEDRQAVKESTVSDRPSFTSPPSAELSDAKATLIFVGDSGELAEPSINLAVWREPDPRGVCTALLVQSGEDLREIDELFPAGASGLSPQFADLLAGALPFDAVALERVADQFFAHLQGLGTGPQVGEFAPLLAPWITAGVLAAATLECIRRQRKRTIPCGPSLIPG
jgi:hypothetical protein